MKMPPALYAALRDDMHEVCRENSIFLNADAPDGLLWNLFHAVMRDRQYDDDHPGFTQGHWTRVLAYQDRFWLDQFYKAADLNDTHIATALRKIARGYPHYHRNQKGT